MMESKNEQFNATVLLTGGSGKLGSAIRASGLFTSLLSPSREELDISTQESVEKYFLENDFDAIIHCAAIARMTICEQDPIKAINTNIIGTANLVKTTIQKEIFAKKSIRFIALSTDGVYPSQNGNYAENDPVGPYNNYGWTKLGAECSVNLLNNYCIIRTRFFDENNIPFETSATDAFTSTIPAKDLAKEIVRALNINFVGTVNIGGERISDYEVYRRYKPTIQPCKQAEILKNVNFNVSKDASMKTDLWESLKNAN